MVTTHEMTGLRVNAAFAEGGQSVGALVNEDLKRIRILRLPNDELLPQNGDSSGPIDLQIFDRGNRVPMLEEVKG